MTSLHMVTYKKNWNIKIDCAYKTSVLNFACPLTLYFSILCIFLCIYLSFYFYFLYFLNQTDIVLHCKCNHASYTISLESFNLLYITHNEHNCGQFMQNHQWMALKFIFSILCEAFFICRFSLKFLEEMAEIAAKHVKIGDKVYVSGSMNVSHSTNSEEIEVGNISSTLNHVYYHFSKGHLIERLRCLEALFWAFFLFCNAFFNWNVFCMKWMGSIHSLSFVSLLNMFWYIQKYNFILLHKNNLLDSKYHEYEWMLTWHEEGKLNITSQTKTWSWTW